jgi:YNFM family putative membrane transporter
LTILSAFTPDFHLFLVLRLFQGIAIAGFPSIAMTYLNEEFSPRDIGRVIGYYVSGTAIGGLTGRILTGCLTDISNWQMAFLIEGILSLSASIWFLLYLPDSNNFNKINISFRRFASGLKNTLLNGRLACMYLTGFFLMGAYVIVLNYIGYPLTNPPYNLSHTVFGFLFVVNIFGVLSSMIFGRLADRYSRRVIMAVALAIFLAGVLLTLNQSLIVKILGIALVAFGFLAGHSVASGWVGFIASKDQKGPASSYYLLFYYVGSSVLGWVGGIFLRAFGWNGVVFCVCASIVIAGLASVRPFSRRLDS